MQIGSPCHGLTPSRAARRTRQAEAWQPRLQLQTIRAHTNELLTEGATETAVVVLFGSTN